MKIAFLQKIVMALTVVMATITLHAQSRQDTIAIREILDEEVASWNRGDAQTYSQHFAADGTFTNILVCSILDIKTFLKGTIRFSKVSSIRRSSVKDWFF